MIDFSLALTREQVENDLRRLREHSKLKEKIDLWSLWWISFIFLHQVSGCLLTLLLQCWLYGFLLHWFHHHLWFMDGVFVLLFLFILLIELAYFPKGKGSYQQIYLHLMTTYSWCYRTTRFGIIWMFKMKLEKVPLLVKHQKSYTLH